jgi:hypothetical protein
MSVQLSATQFLKRSWSIRKWIEEILHEELTAPDLFVCLQNGVILCRVMLCIKEHSIPKIHTNTTLQFKIRENIMFFLQSCEELLLPRHKLFAIPDLMENKNLYKVLECIEELAIIAERDCLTPIVMKPITEDILLFCFVYLQQTSFTTRRIHKLYPHSQLP